MPEQPTDKVVDLMAALEQSVTAAKAARRAQETPTPEVNAVEAAAIAAGMTPREAATWEAVRAAASSYLRLTDDETHHPMEREEICHAFHVIQGWLAGRPFVRALTGGET